MSEVPVWTCDLAALPEKNANDMTALTVGARFGMKCHGEIAVAWDASKPHLAFATPDESYTLQILKVIRQDPNDAQYEVTSYKPGDHAPEYLRVLQGGPGGEKGFEVAHPKWTVKSVLKPNEQNQPYGSFGPWRLSLPLWFIILICVVSLAVIGFVVRRVRKYQQRRRMLEELDRHRTAMPPLHQFYRDARLLSRRMHTAKDPVEFKQLSEDLNREFRLFVLRQFRIPAFDWSNRSIVKDLRQRHRKVYRASGIPLRKTLRELDHLRSRNEITAKDIEQMYRMSLDTAEKLEGGRA
jgi:hypothetical protein